MSKFQNFVTPHCHPQSLDSASTPKSFAKLEKELGTGGITCTDHGSLGATYKIYDLAKKNGLIPVLGLEAYFRDDKCPILTKHNIPKTGTVPKGSNKEEWLSYNPDGTYIDYNKYYHTTIHFQDYDAYLKGVKLLSKADARAELHGKERKPLFGWGDMEELGSMNVTLGSGCLIGMASRHLISDKIDGSTKVSLAKAYFDRLYGIFGQKMFVEVFPHRCTHNWVQGVFIYVAGRIDPIVHYFNKTLKIDGVEMKAEELGRTWKNKKYKKFDAVKNYYTWEDVGAEIERVELKEEFVQNECSPAAPNGDLQWGVNKFMMGLAKKYGLRTLISDDAHFTLPEYKVVQDVRLAQSGSWRFHETYCRITSDQAWDYFSKEMGVDQTTFEKWIQDSKDWLQGFKDFKFDTKVELPTKFFPKDTLAHTKELILKHGRMPKNPVYVARLRQEIKLLHDNGVVDLLPYLWIDEEVCRLYRNQGNLTGPGRGSAGGLLLAYLLGITHVDPILNNLSLDRFLTIDRIKSGKFPDIDQDLRSRDLLEGYECDVVEVEAEDGSKHILPEDFKIETSVGVYPIKEALDKGLDFTPWW